MSELYVIPSIQETTAKKLRVATYVRVSTDDYDQENSFLNQYDYYSRYIKANPEWEFVDIYADEGITGTELKNRDEFNRMVEDCKNRKIDLVIVKSISRFARNTYDCLKYVRALKQYGTDVKFEKECIDTRKMTNETELAVLSSMAQEESISVSKNVRLGIKHKMMDGTYHYGKVPYGYRKSGASMVIEEQEARIVRLIYNAFLSGKSYREIAEELKEADVTRGRDYKEYISVQTIKYVLRNITYTGDVILQKSYGEEFPYKRKKNNGEVTQYLVKDYCPAIISKEIYEMVQKKRALKRSRSENTENKKSDFEKMIYCQRCGMKFGRLRNLNWYCKEDSRKDAESRIEPITEKKIKAGFIECYNRLYANIENILIPILNHIQEYKNFQNRTDQKIEDINNRIAQITEQILIIGKLKTDGCMESAIYMQKNTELNAELTRLKKDKKTLAGNNNCDTLSRETTRIIRVLESSGAIAEFDVNIFKAIVDKVWICDNTSYIYELINGVKMKTSLNEVGL